MDWNVRALLRKELTNLNLSGLVIDTEASILEEPGALVPHAGICAGAVG